MTRGHPSPTPLPKVSLPAHLSSSSQARGIPFPPRLLPDPRAKMSLPIQPKLWASVALVTLAFLCFWGDTFLMKGPGRAAHRPHPLVLPTQHLIKITQPTGKAFRRTGPRAPSSSLHPDFIWHEQAPRTLQPGPQPLREYVWMTRRRRKFQLNLVTTKLRVISSVDACQIALAEKYSWCNSVNWQEETYV